MKTLACTIASAWELIIFAITACGGGGTFRLLLLLPYDRILCQPRLDLLAAQ